MPMGGIPPKQSTHFLFSNVRTSLNPYVHTVTPTPTPQSPQPHGHVWSLGHFSRPHQVKVVPIALHTR